MKKITLAGWKMVAVMALLAIGSVRPGHAQENKTKKWEQVPPAVQTTILANGGTMGPVDKENQKIGGNIVYEAPGKDKNGQPVDLVVAEDGTLVMTKDDDVADRAKELAVQAKKTNAGPTLLKFSHPREITNPYLPLATLKQDILEGKEDGAKVRVERTAKPDAHKTFKIGGQIVEALVVEDREFENGELHEVATDYFAQDDAGTVYYLGEDVDEIKGGKVVGHSGAWLFGVDTKTPGVLLPAHPKVGDKFKSEDVSRSIREEDEVLSVSETVTVPAGTFQHCVKVKERLADGKIEFKFYAPGVGVVKEVPEDGEVVLKAHTTR